MYVLGMDLDAMYSRIVSDVEKGLSYQSMKVKYPLMTRNLYRKLGGARAGRRPLPDNDTVRMVTGGSVHDPVDEGPLDNDLIVGSLMGDGCLEPVSSETVLFREIHCWAQIAYVAMKWEQLKPRSSGITLRKPRGGLSDYSICITSLSSPVLYRYYRAFYSVEEGGKKLLQRNTLSEDVLEFLNPRSLAYWVMDDGKARGRTRGCFCLTVGIKPWHDLESVSKIAGVISDRVGFRVHGRASGRAISFWTKSESCEAVIKRVAPHVHPMFSYKLNLSEEEVGDAVRGYGWYKDWESRRHLARHPFLESHSYVDYRLSKSDTFKERYFRALLARTVVRGFPYPRIDEAELEGAWSLIREACVRETDGRFSCHPKVNKFPSSFMHHRFKMRHRSRPSPYEVYSDRKRLSSVLRKQLKCGPAIEDTNLRNALCVYGTTALGQFNTGIVRHLVESYCPEGGIVLDPCAGWGNRLCGSVSCGRGYYGIEPATETYESLLRIRSWLSGRVSPLRVRLINSVAEDEGSYGGGLFGFAITSPPYFDLESYGVEESQSSVRYTSYGRWLDCFLKPMIENVFRHLADGAVFCVNVSDSCGHPLESDTLSAAVDAGFSHESVWRMPGHRIPGMSTVYSEPVFVLRKMGGC